MSDEPIFRFISVRQPLKVLQTERKPAGGRTSLSVNLHDKPENDLQRQIRDHVVAGRGAEARRLAEEAKKNGRLLSSLDELDADIVAALDWAQYHRGKPFKDIDIAAEIESATGKSLKDLVASNEFTATKLKLEDSLVIAATLGETGSVNSLALDALKIIKLIENAAAGTLKPKPKVTLGEFLSASTVIVPSPARAELGSQVTPPFCPATACQE